MSLGSKPIGVYENSRNHMLYVLTDDCYLHAINNRSKRYVRKVRLDQAWEILMIPSICESLIEINKGLLKTPEDGLSFRNFEAILTELSTMQP